VKRLGSICRAERWPIISFAVGTILVALGIVRIVGSRYTDWHWVLTCDPGIDAGYFYTAWDEGQLAKGIALALLGTALSSASYTYLVLRRKEKGFASGSTSPD